MTHGKATAPGMGVILTSGQAAALLPDTDHIRCFRVTGLLDIDRSDALRRISMAAVLTLAGPAMRTIGYGLAVTCINGDTTHFATDHGRIAALVADLPVTGGPAPAPDGPVHLSLAEALARIPLGETVFTISEPEPGAHLRIGAPRELVLDMLSTAKAMTEAPVAWAKAGYTIRLVSPITGTDVYIETEPWRFADLIRGDDGAMVVPALAFSPEDRQRFKSYWLDHSRMGGGVVIPAGPDYRAMLKAYMRGVMEEESISFLHSIQFQTPPIIDSWLVELRAIEAEILAERAR